MKNLLFLALFIISFQSFAQNISFYLGTYTDTTSEGIYKYSLNTETGEIGNKQLVAKIKNPSFLAFSKAKNYLYAVSEVNNFEMLNSGSVSAFKVDSNGSIQLINTVSSNGAHPCHVQINGDNATVSNYSGGTVSLHQIEKLGKISKAYQIINHNTTPKKSHAHSAKIFNNNLFVADLGLDFLAHYEKKGNSFLLKQKYSMPSKFGPRHFEISKKGDFIYVINELNSSITVLKKEHQSFKEIQNLSTIDKDFKVESFCADIHLSKNGEYLYGSNRGENTIAVFKIDELNGTLKKIQSISTFGNWPRNFNLSPDGNLLLAANQKSKNISVYRVNKVSGKLKYLHSTNTPTPTCLIF